ncbi:MAG TPA: hypothetical protein PLC98_23360 [Anaerolineales bacterium]|nr:hypothetical protein [Anaerolineales bacterium]
MGVIIEVGSIVFAIAVQIGVQLVFGAVAIAWVNGRSDYDTFRRWRAAFCIAALSLIMIDAMSGFGLLLIQFWPSLASQDPAGMVTHTVLSPLLVLLGAGIGIGSVPFALVVLVGSAIQIQLGADTLADWFGWLDRYWKNPYANNRVSTLLPEQRFL